MIVPSYLDYVVERDRHSLAKVSAIAAGALLGASSLFGQSLMNSRGTNLYAAASVRAAQAGGEFDDIQMLPDRMTITNATAKHLIEWAYQVKDYQVAGRQIRPYTHWWRLDMSRNSLRIPTSW
jgi:hypothetical protein